MNPQLHPLLSKLMRRVSSLAGGRHTGRLMDATAAIQRALGGVASARKAAGGTVFDGLVKEVHEAPHATPTAPDIADPTPDAHLDPAVAHFLPGTFTGASGTRLYKLFVPRGFEGRALPLVVMLHGCTQDPDDFARGTRMNQVAQEHGFLVLYPAQAPRSNSSKCWNWFNPGDQKRGLGEPALLAGMTRHVMATHAVDANRVYVAGLSAGGAMAAILGREYADLFAAVGVHSGLPQGAAHDVMSAFQAMKAGPSTQRAASSGALPPTIVFHGDDDHTVNPLNGQQVIGDAVGASSGTAAEGTAPGGRRFTQTTYPDASGQPRAEHWTVHGSGHAWSGGSADGTYVDAQGPDASREMWRFFSAHAAVH
jgi:poly(hydroxyalkanoate) depolymerase family esterase